VEFISCNSKKSKPKVHVSVCKACKRRRSCDDYSRYRQPLLFPDLAFLGNVKKTRKKRAYTKPAEAIRKQEQLGMEKLFDRA
jgi:hypothetical protein